MTRRRKRNLNPISKLLTFTLVLAAAYFGYNTVRSELTTKTGLLTITALDVGQGDAFLIQTPTGKNVLIDAGTNKDTLQLLKGINSITLLVATHPHSDHIGGMKAILSSIPVTRFLDSGQIYSSTTYERMLETIKTKKIPFTQAKRGQKIQVDDVTFEVLNPGKDFIENVGSGRSIENANSVVLRLIYNNFSMLFTGDAEFETEAQMMAAKLPLASTILKIGHHGSRHATSGKFLATVNPEAVIISVGRNNEYGHPTPETLQRLKGIQIFRTDEFGSITIQTDGKSWTKK